MNTVVLKGVPKDIEYSHTINNVNYYQCNFEVNDPKKPNITDTIIVKFKQFSNKFIEGQETQIFGNIRSYTTKQNGKNKVTIYVYTYQDPFDNIDNDYNYVELDGRICKKDILWKSEKTGKYSYHFTLANNIYTDGTKINSYISCVAYGKLAIAISKLEVNQKVQLQGQLHSRTYNKVLSDGSIEENMAHEVLVTDFKIQEDD